MTSLKISASVRSFRLPRPWGLARLPGLNCECRGGFLIVLQRVVARARGDTAERLHTGSAPGSPVVWRDYLGRHGASSGLAVDQREPAALPHTNDQAAKLAVALFPIDPITSLGRSRAHQR